MNRRVLLCCVLSGLIAGGTSKSTAVHAQSVPVSASDFGFSMTDWPWWRGPLRNGTAQPDQNPPLTWSESENVEWKVPVPGRGHGSPTIVGNQILLATADIDAQKQTVISFDRATGKVLWQTDVHSGGLEVKGNGKASLASSSVACDGQRFFINFLNDGGMVTSAISMDGKIQWQTRLTDYVVHQGYGASPAIYGPLVITTADNKGGAGAIAGLDRATGKVVWKQPRPKTPNYSSPIVLHVAGRDQLIMIGCDLAAGFDPLTGKELWSVEGATTECVTSTVTDGKVIITSGGYPRNHVAAVAADGSGKVVWNNGTRVYVPSLVLRDGHLYAAADAGIAMCWNISTGEEVWKGRLGGTFSSSPVLVGDRIYATNEAGHTWVFKADPSGFEVLAENDLGTDVFATPTIVGGRIYTRVAHDEDGKRQEYLYCLGKN